jgi:GNAT superfamily N-acetyltransferase
MEEEPSREEQAGFRRDWKPRKAVVGDIPEIEGLIPLSVRKLQAPYYSEAQMDAAIGTVFGVDRQLICDGTYFVVESGKQVIGCGGWSRRASLFGSDRARLVEDRELNPKTDPARIRAFFVHPEWARRGVGASIMTACERSMAEAGFGAVVIVSTLAGEPLYASFGYEVLERFDIGLPPGGLALPAVRMGKTLLKPGPVA